MTAEDYWRQLQALLPTGAAWTQRATALLNQLLLAFAQEFARVDARAWTLIEEADPRTTVELLPDWERIAGLPDPCLGPSPTVAARRASLVQKLTELGGQSIDYLIGVAARIGFTITITEFRPWNVDDACNLPIYGDSWWFAWRVNAPAVTSRFFTTQSGCDEPLQTWGNAVLECVLRAIAPAHTFLIFAYGP